MTKEQIFELINGMQNPVMYVATSENGQPHVRGILLYSADENGIVFHTGKFKALHKILFLLFRLFFQKQDLICE